MAVSLTSIACFSSTNLQAKYQQLPRFTASVLPLKSDQVAPTLSAFGSRKAFKEYRLSLSLSVANGNRLATDTDGEGSSSLENSVSDTSRLSDTSAESIGSALSQDLPATPKRSPLTARERLRAARVRSRDTESKSSKSEMGSKVLDALKESDRGKKRSGLPEAPTNLFDDSKRGMPKKGLTFQFPGGIDLFFIVLSFVLISTAMFSTTYIVWKVGAIHFNEY